MFGNGGVGFGWRPGTETEYISGKTQFVPDILGAITVLRPHKGFDLQKYPIDQNLYEFPENTPQELQNLVYNTQYGRTMDMVETAGGLVDVDSAAAVNAFGKDYPRFRREVRATYDHTYQELHGPVDENQINHMPSLPVAITQDITDSQLRLLELKPELEKGDLRRLRKLFSNSGKLATELEKLGIRDFTPTKTPWTLKLARINNLSGVTSLGGDMLVKIMLGQLPFDKTVQVNVYAIGFIFATHFLKFHHKAA